MAKHLYYDCLLGMMLVRPKQPSWAQIQDQIKCLKAGQRILDGDVSLEAMTDQQRAWHYQYQEDSKLHSEIQTQIDFLTKQERTSKEAVSQMQQRKRPSHEIAAERQRLE